MEPGIYTGLSNELYHSGAGVSKSGLDKIAQSGAHYYHAYGQRQEALAAADEAGEEYVGAPWVERMTSETGYTILGRAMHCLMFEPAQFGREFIRAEKFSGTGSRSAQAEWNASIGTRTPLRVEEMQALSEMRASLGRSKAITRILDKTQGVGEVSVYWTDEPTGELVRVRPDWWRHDGIVVDLKCVQDASPEAFARICAQRRYYMADALYSDGCAIASQGTDYTFRNFLFVAVESKPPYECAVYHLDEISRDIGRQEYRRLLDKYAEHVRAGFWSGYPDRIQPLSLPDWMIRQAEFTTSES